MAECMAGSKDKRDYEATILYKYNNNYNYEAPIKFKKGTRAYKRNNYKASIKYKYYDSLTFSSARMYNYSQGGMYFESDYNIPPGSDIYITMDNYSPDAKKGPEAFEGYHANVKWGKQSSDSHHYGIGVEFYDW